MEVLIELSKIVFSRSNVHNVLPKEVFGSSTQMSKLHHGIKSGSVTTDQEGRKYLYGTSKPTSKYYEVKRRLKSKLINLLFVYTPAQDPARDSLDMLQTCLKNIHASMILSRKQSKHAAMKLLESIIPTSQKFEFTDVTLLAAKYLLGYYAIGNPDKSKYENLSHIVIKCQHILAGESYAEIAYFDFLVQFAHTQKALSDRSIELLQHKHDENLRKYQNINSRRFLRLYYSYQILIAESKGLNLEAYNLSQKAQKLIISKPYPAPGAIFALELYAMSSLIKLKRYKECEIGANRQMQMWSRHPTNWYIIAFYYFILKCHGRNYTDAYNKSYQAIQRSVFKSQSPRIKQIWYVNEAYAHFFYKCGKVEITEEEESKIKKFRIYKFLNEVPIYSNDKAGVNISILIIQMLFLIWEKKYKAAHDRISSLNSYCQKYLSKGETYRSHCFIKMLVQLAKADLHPVRGQRYAQKYYDKLIAHPFAKSRQAIEVEVVPYEDLWTLILEMCDRNGNGYQSKVTASIKSR